MSLPQLPLNHSLERTWDDLVFSEAQLQEDDFALTFAPRITPLIERCETAQASQKKLRRREIGANAKVSALNRRLDHLSEDFDSTLLGVCRKDRKSPLYKRYFPEAPYKVIRLGLGSQVEACKGWPTFLATESDPALQAYAPKFEAIFAEAKLALEEREQAQLERQIHRSRVIEPLIEDANAVRLSIFGHLTQHTADSKLGNEWARSFFP